MAPNDYRQRVRIKRCCEKLVGTRGHGHLDRHLERVRQLPVLRAGVQEVRGRDPDRVSPPVWSRPSTIGAPASGAGCDPRCRVVTVQDGRRMSVTQQVRTGPRAEMVLLIGALSAFAPLSIDMYLPGLPAIATDLGATPAEVQLTLTACLVGLAARPAHLWPTERHLRSSAAAPRRSRDVHGRVPAVRRGAIGVGPHRAPGAPGFRRRGGHRHRARRGARPLRRVGSCPVLRAHDARQRPGAHPGAHHRRPAAAHHHVAGRVRGRSAPSARCCSWPPGSGCANCCPRNVAAADASRTSRGPIEGWSRTADSCATCWRRRSRSPPCSDTSRRRRSSSRTSSASHPRCSACSSPSMRWASWS